MKKLIIYSLFSLIGSLCFAQKIRNEFILIDSSHRGISGYFLASNQNAWNPGDSSLKFRKYNDGTNHLVVFMDKGTQMEFKFTRGSWQSGECLANGNDVDNHRLTVDTDTVRIYAVHAWKDQFKPVEKRHTASFNVRVLDTAFFIPQLNRKTRIWIYLPKDYQKTNQHYPVLYMQDGQNLFDEYTSGFGEWGIDECLDTLASKTKPCIVVGIASGIKRLNEYNPYDNTRFGKGEGDPYSAFLVKTLKPYIDKHFRTLRTRNNTLIAGSSMGGLISYYAIMKYPEVFGKAGIFSPSFWIAPEMIGLTDSIGHSARGKFFFYIGREEGDSYVKDMEQITGKLKAYTGNKVYSIIDPGGRHNETAWRKWFPVFYRWMMTDVKTK